MSDAFSNLFLDIIVAEDEPITRMRITRVLQDLGHTVRAFSDGADAWQSFDESPARVVISDWQMPEMDGTDFCRRIRQREKTEYTYFILITGERSEDADYDDAINAGADDFLLKPVSRDSIWRRLRVAKRILGFTNHIRQLEQLIPICCYCRQVREDDEYQSSLEEYIQAHTGSRFSHGVCPTCYDRVAKELDLLPETAVS